MLKRKGCITAASYCLGGRGTTVMVPLLLSSGAVITLLFTVVLLLWLLFHLVSHMLLHLVSCSSLQLLCNAKLLVLSPTFLWSRIPLCFHLWSAPPADAPPLVWSCQPLLSGSTAPSSLWSGPVLHCNWLIVEIWLDLNQGSLALSASAHTAEPQISNYACAETYTSLLTCGFCNYVRLNLGPERSGKRQVWRCGVTVAFACSCSQQVCTPATGSRLTYIKHAYISHLSFQSSNNHNQWHKHHLFYSCYMQHKAFITIIKLVCKTHHSKWYDFNQNMFCCLQLRKT